MTAWHIPPLVLLLCGNRQDVEMKIWANMRGGEETTRIINMIGGHDMTGIPSLGLQPVII